MGTTKMKGGYHLIVMSRNNIVFKVRISKQLKSIIEENAQKKEKKKCTFIREQLERDFNYSQTDIKELEEIYDKIKTQGNKINSYARKYNTYGVHNFSVGLTESLSAAKKLYEDALIILSREKHLNYNTYGDELELKSQSLYIRLSSECYSKIKRIAADNNVSSGRIIRSLLMNPLEYSIVDFRKILKKMCYEKNKIVTNLGQIKDRYMDSNLNENDVRKFKKALLKYIEIMDRYEIEIRRRMYNGDN